MAMGCISLSTQQERHPLFQPNVYLPLNRVNGLEYLFFGTVTATLEAAAGAGIVSAFILQSDDLDEIDWEWLGGATTDVQSNYFSRGNTSTYDRGATHAVSSPQTSYHSTTPFPLIMEIEANSVAYSINWTPAALEWIIDGTVVRTLEASS